ncbi:MAG: response regulator [Okeania sp. SIO2F4]|uniref:response regulator n=1 Tax=Okeania sp. SIO2F4 TaxID=2607790 RepID=UPI0014293B98|nr:response regulator [Okeania sp. SIO2F4]NES07775.1 response regulator [Okeania sp. SIO2F4]
MKRIIIVDNEEDMHYLFSRKFRKEIKAGEVEIISFMSVIEALSYLDSSEKKHIDLIISDINLPIVNGLELLQIIKEKYAQINVWMLTAHGYNENYKLAKEYGANDYIVKPINFEEIKQKILNL